MFILLLALWIIFNGRFTLEILVTGIVVSAAVCIFLKIFASYSFEKELKMLKLVPSLFVYLMVLLIEIIKANLSVIKVTLFGADNVRPVVVHFKTGLKSRLYKVILANSITLTPGTITASLHGDEFYVHCLDESFAKGIESSVFVRRLESMEARL